MYKMFRMYCIFFAVLMTSSRLLTQEVTDYTRPLTFTVSVGLQRADEGPVLDDGWPTSLKSEVKQMKTDQ